MHLLFVKFFFHLEMKDGLRACTIKHFTDVINCKLSHFHPCLKLKTRQQPTLRVKSHADLYSGRLQPCLQMLG